jgi:hypothetical protein
MYIFFGMVLASMIFELRKEVLAHLLQGSKMRMRINIKKDWAHTQKNSHKRVSDNRKVFYRKGVLILGVLLRYRCVCLGMVLALIHPHIRQVFDTHKTHIQSLFS